MRNKLSLSLVLAALSLAACSKESPELIPCMCNASDYLVESPGLFDCMCDKAKKKPVRRISYLQDKCSEYMDCSNRDRIFLSL